jgi:cation transport ATPase
MPGALIFVLVVVAAHALGTAFGGWAVIEENRSKQEHGQDLLMPMAMAWFVALLCWGLAALQAVCVVLARKRGAWVRVVLIVCLAFVSLSTAVGFLGSLVAGTPSLPVFVIAGIDVAALWMVSGHRGRRYFSVGSPAPASSQGW